MKFFNQGGTQADIDGNCGADELAKQGADERKPNSDLYKTFGLRCKLSRIMQDYLADVWIAEYTRWQDDKQIQRCAQDESNDIQAVMQEQHDIHAKRKIRKKTRLDR